MKRLLLVLLGCAGCALDLGVPTNLAITCATNVDCPTGSICDTNLGKCVSTDTPTVRVDVPDELATRYTREVPFQVDMVSANASARFDLQIEFRLKGDTNQTWFPLTLAQSSAPATGLVGSASGSRYALVWDALRDATNANGLDLVRVDLDADGQIADPIVRTADVVIRVVARNASGAVESVPAESAPFTIGNAPPSAAILATIGDSGVINVVVGLSDSSADTCGFELQFRGPDGVWRTAALTYGTTEMLGCLSTGALNASVGWDSRAPYYDPDVQPPGTPQGIGNITLPSALDGTRILLRVRAYDSAEASRPEQHWGLWSPPRVLTRVVNQTSPIIVGAHAPRGAIMGGTGPVHIRYTLVDAESDPADVTIEFSQDAGATYVRCPEYPYALSEGMSQLATAPLGVGGGGGGVEHLFTWDASSVGPVVPTTTLVRITADDGQTAAVVSAFELGSPAAPSGDAPHSAFARTLFNRNLFNSNGTTQTCCATDVAMADFNNDGAKDLVFAKPGSDALTFSRSTGATVPWPETYLTGVVNIVVAGNFLNDATKQSVLGIATSGAATFWSGNGAMAFGVDTSFNVGSGVIDAAASDVNKDGYADLVVARDLGGGNYAVAVHLNAKVVTTRFSNTPTFTTTFGGVLSMAVGDLDGDGFTDIAVITQQRDGHVLGGQGNGQFSEIATFNGENSYGSESLGIGDVNGDGFADLVNVDGSDIIYNLGSGSPGNVTYEEVRPEARFLTPSVDYMRVADFNGDGLADVVGSDSWSTAFCFILSALDATGELSPQIGSVAVSNGGVFADDLDGDGIGELVALTGNGLASFAVLFMDGPSTVGGQMYRPGPSVPNVFGVPVIADFDADGVPDLLSFFGEAFLRRGVGGAGVGDGAFGPAEFIFLDMPDQDARVVDVRAADLNNDGALDLVFLTMTQVDVPVFHFEAKLGWVLARPLQGVADGRFATPQLLSIGVSTSLNSLAVADFDADGKLDAAYLYTDDLSGLNWNLGVAFNRGTPTFTQQDATYVIGPTTVRLGVGYIGADPLPDLIAAVRDGGQVRLFASGTTPVSRANPFTTVSNIATGGPPDEAQLVDLNWDGVSDVWMRESTFIEMHNGIAAGGFGGTLSYFPNDYMLNGLYLDASLDGINDFLFLGFPLQEIGGVSAGAAPGGVPNNTFAATPKTFAAEATGDDVITTRDLNCDAVTDYVIATPNHIVFMGRSRDMFTPALAVSVPPYNGKHASPLAGLGLTGVASHPWHIANGGPCAEQTRWEDDLRADRARKGLSPRFRVLAPARWLGETTRYKKTAVGDDVRWLRASRFTPPLSLATNGAPRGFVATISAAPARRASVIPAKLKVYWQHDVLSTAADITQDPLHGAPNATQMLPRMLTSRGLTDVVQHHWTWTEIPLDGDGNLTTGTGKRYIYNAASGLADILTDEGGLYVLVEDL